MSDRSWFFASQGRQQGPYMEAQLRDFIANGAISAETLVWTEGMTDWRRAGDIPGLLRDAVPSALPSSSVSSTGDIRANQILSADFGTWTLLGRGLLATFGIALLIPAPWAATAFYRWLVAHLHIPQRPDAVFAGNPADIWYVFVIQGLFAWARFADSSYLTFVLVPIEGFFWWLVLRWLVMNISPDGHGRPLAFSGSAWGYIGWYCLAFVSFLSVIGWAWVWTAWARWTCRHIQGTRRQIIFNATGWQILWRTLLFVLATALIIPIPWAFAWYARWSVSQFSLVQRSGYANA
ncbi:MAG TPA: DUF4339 domain-containing protein [Bradyrhizobium sp.]|nr:DUF4339 domain-containing protein [Bradyrhizobium sp.]